MKAPWRSKANTNGVESVNGLVSVLAAILLSTQSVCGADSNQRKALMIGDGEAFYRPGSEATHPQVARKNFLKLVGNVANDPAKGWVCDFTGDLMRQLGMDPTNTPVETLFNYIGQHRLGYRVAMCCGPAGYTGSCWGCAVDNGMMPFGPQGNNNNGLRLDDPVGLRAAVGVAGGTSGNWTSYGPGVEVIDALPLWASWSNFEDAAQSWANQAAAAKFAKILDAHPQYNIWDARQHLRQAASFWSHGWTETNGYGRVNENAVVGHLLPGQPVDFRVVKSRDRHRVTFSWRNFLQSDFAATVIARKDGRILYESTGTNFVWTSDVDGDETFVYWSKNKAGEKSRLETYQTRKVTGLNRGLRQTCLVLGAPHGQEDLNWTLCNQFQQAATNWVCDIAFQPGHPFYDKNPGYAAGPVVAVLADFSAMVTYAISNHYRILVAPVAYPDRDDFRFKTEWDRATAAGMLVVVPHHTSLSTSRKPQARRVSPPRLSSAITVGAGLTNNLRSFGPGLEFFDAPAAEGGPYGGPIQTEAAAIIAAKLAQILDAHPAYNSWDARQHLRQSASGYTRGWVEDGGYGRPPARPANTERLDPAPPLDIQAQRAADGGSVTFSWQNFLQSSFAETVITRADGRTVYHGAGTNLIWRSDVNGDETFQFFSRDKSGRLSKPESYTVLRISGLRS